MKGVYKSIINENKFMLNEKQLQKARQLEEI
jgi:hypothetical protein